MRVNFRYITTLSLLFCIWVMQSSFAQESSNDFGNELLRQRCARCHAIGLDDQSRHSMAPAFRDVVRRYKAELLAEALAEGILVGHPDMPVVTFEPHEVSAIIQYLERLSEKSR